MTTGPGEMVTSHSLDIMIVETPVTCYIHWTTSFNLCTSNRAVKLSWLPSGLVSKEGRMGITNAAFYNVLTVRSKDDIFQFNKTETIFDILLIYYLLLRLYDNCNN